MIEEKNENQDGTKRNEDQGKMFYVHLEKETRGLHKKSS